MNQIDLVRAAVAGLGREFSLADIYARLGGEPLTRRNISSCLAQMIDEQELSRVGHYHRRDALHRFRRGPKPISTEALAAIEAHRNACCAIDSLVQRWTIRREQRTA